MRPDRQDDARARLELARRHPQPYGAPRDGIPRRGDALHDVGAADELGHEARAWPVVEIVGGAGLRHPPGLQHGDSIGDHHRLRLVVRDVERRDAERLVQAPDLEAHLLAQVGVEIGQRLVQQQDLGLDDQRARHRDALLLATRQLPGVPRLVSGQLDDTQHLAHAGLAVAARQAGLEAQTVGDVLRHRHVRPQRVALEDHRHAPSLGRHDAGGRRQTAVADPDLAGLRRQKAGDEPQRGGLAAARGPQQREQLSRLDLERQAVDRADVTVALRERLEDHAWHRASLSGARRARRGRAPPARARPWRR